MVLFVASVIGSDGTGAKWKPTARLKCCNETKFEAGGKVTMIAPRCGKIAGNPLAEPKKRRKKRRCKLFEQHEAAAEEEKKK